MLKKKSFRSIPEPVILTLLLGFLATGYPVEAIQVAGTSTDGVAFAGSIVSADENTLFLLQESHGEVIQTGIPLNSVGELYLESSSNDPPDSLNELEPYFSLIPYWDSATIMKILSWLETEAVAGEWRRVWRWTEQLTESGASGNIALEARLLKARALCQLGMYSKLDEELKILNGSWTPMEAPIQLCWLNAVQHRHLGNPAAAFFWAKLPGLRLSSMEDRALDACASLATALIRNQPKLFPEIP